MAYTEEERAFLTTHRWATLATGRRDGSPQQAMVGYTVDDEGRILVSTPQASAKWRNAAREPRVSLAVSEDRVQLVVYGSAELITDEPERAELTADVIAVVRGPDRPDPASIVGWLDKEQRGILRVTAEKVMLHH